MYPQAGHPVLPGQTPGTPPGSAPVNAPALHAQPHRNAPKRPKLQQLTVSCPMVVAAMGAGGGGFVPLPITRLGMEAQAQISVGFNKITLDCYYPQTWQGAPLQLLVPKTSATVISEVVIENLVRDQIYATAIVPAEDAQKANYKPASAVDASGAAVPEAHLNDPELFVLPMPGRAAPGDQFRVSLTTFEPLAFEEGSYVLRLPTELPAAMIPQGYSHTQLLDVIVTINTGSPTPVAYAVRSGHPVTDSTPPGGGAGTATFSISKAPQLPNADVDVGYRVWGNDMFLALNVSNPRPPHPADPDPRGAFVLSVAPPAPEFTAPFPRSVVFLLDRSGSMSGEPMEFAKAALCFGLRSLTPLDTFTVVAFDHEQLWFTPGGQLVPGSVENVSAAESWVRASVDARGLTDIMTPLQTAMRVLSGAAPGAERPPGAPPSLPFIFLVTDGCVQDEKDICRFVEGHMRGLLQHQQQQAMGAAAAGAPPPPPAGVPRICTFGIGTYCNHYFLKQLATYGRGAFDVAFRPHAIQAQMQHLLTAAQRPVLSDLTLTLPGVAGCELYPYPLPDLFCGLPLVVAGKYSGAWPAGGITLNGTLPGGTPWSSKPVFPGKEGNLPLDKIFIKSRLDLLTAQAWLAGNPPQMVNQIVDLSIATGIPCAHTRTVGFETTHKDWAAIQSTAQSQGKRKVNYAKYAIGGAAGLVVLAGLGVGAAFVFGDLGATVANTGFMDGIGGLGGMGDMGGGGDCCGDCGDCGDCGGCDGCDGCDIGGLDCVIS